MPAQIALSIIKNNTVYFLSVKAKSKQIPKQVKLLDLKFLRGGFMVVIMGLIHVKNKSYNRKKEMNFVRH